MQDIPADTLSMVGKLFENHCPLPMANLFMELLGGGKLSRKSISKLRETVLIRRYDSNLNESTAETLIRLLNEDESITHLSCAGSYDQAQQLVRVRKKRKSKGNKVDQEGNCNVSNDHKRFVKEIILGLSLGNNKFLINAMWIDEKAKRYHCLYPDILGVDVNFRTNAEKRGLLRGCSKAIDNRNLPNIFSFMPSSQA